MTKPITPTKRITASGRILLWVGSIGPLGYLPASGTITVALVGVPLFWWKDRVGIAPAGYAVAVLVFAAVSVWLHEAGDRLLGEKDSRKLVWDELAGFFVAVFLVPFSWQIAAVAFFLERTLDIAKIPPARQIENRWPGGWGVVGDDLIAGLYTCGLLHLLLHLAPQLFGPG